MIGAAPTGVAVGTAGVRCDELAPLGSSCPEGRCTRLLRLALTGEDKDRAGATGRGSGDLPRGGMEASSFFVEMRAWEGVLPLGPVRRVGGVACSSLIRIFIGPPCMAENGETLGKGARSC